MSYPIILSSIRHATIELVDEERFRQRQKWGDHQFCGMSSERALAVLTEEVGEVAKACLERTNLKEELIHVAAVALAWLDDLAAMTESS